MMPFAPSGISGILSGAALIFFAYTGFARVTIMAEEVKDPEKTIPRSIFLALAISTTLYIFVSIIAVGLAGASGLSQSGSPLAAAIGITGSTTAVLVISSGAMIATASVLLTTIMGISRIMFAMARTGDLPAFLKRIHPRFSTPHYAIWISGVCMIAAILLADLTLVVAVSTFAMLIFYLIANIAAFRIPLKYRQYPALVPVIGAVSCLGLIGFLTTNSWIIGIIGLALGIVWYFIQHRATR
jgi:basic amino acid/polyamine antiporter, APA family